MAKPIRGVHAPVFRPPCHVQMHFPLTLGKAPRWEESLEELKRDLTAMRKAAQLRTAPTATGRRNQMFYSTYSKLTCLILSPSGLSFSGKQ